ncbi:MAG: tetratricopeptide repeat protein [Burkholderiaceae bacterium]
MPDVDLTGRVLFQIMAAEVALQRGEPGAAFKTYLNVAHETRDPRLAKRAAEIALSARAGKEAIEAVELWRELAPQSNDAAEALASLDLTLGRYDEAFPILAELLTRSDRPAELISRIQRQLVRSPDPARAFALLERLSLPYLKDANVRLSLAAGAQAAGQMSRAMTEARAALELAPDSPHAVLASAQLIYGSDIKAATQLLASFLTTHEKATEVRLAYARLLVAGENFDQARQQFSILLKDAPHSPDLLYALGVLSIQGKLYTDARAHFTRYLALIEEAQDASRDPDGAYLNLALIAEEEKKYDEALGWLAKIDEGNQYIQARIREAFLLAKTGRIDQARQRLQTATTSAADERSQLILAEAQLLRESNRTDEALAVLEAALAANPDDPSLLYDAAMAAEKLDQVTRMEELLRLLIKAKPDNAHAYNALGYSLADRNLRLPEARELIGQALKLSPNDAFILDSMGWVYFRMGELKQAREYLERAYQLRPEPEVMVHLAEILWAQGDHEAARQLLLEVKNQEPDNELLKSTSTRLKLKL